MVDGPFIETKEVIGGFAILEAKSKTEALALTQRFLKVHGDEMGHRVRSAPDRGPEFGGEG